MARHHTHTVACANSPTFTVIHNFMAAPAIARHWRRNLVTGEDNAVPAGAHRWWAHLAAQKERKKRKSSALGHEVGKGNDPQVCCSAGARKAHTV